MKRYIRAVTQDWKEIRHTLSLRDNGSVEGWCYERQLSDRYLVTVYPKYSKDYSDPAWELTIYDRIFPVESKIFDTVDEAKRFADTKLYNKYCV